MDPIYTALFLKFTFFFLFFITLSFSFVSLLSVANVYLELCGWNQQRRVQFSA